MRRRDVDGQHITMTINQAYWVRAALLDSLGWETGRSQSASILEPLSARQRNAIRMGFRWRADSGSRLDADLDARASSLKSYTVM